MLKKLLRALLVLLRAFFVLLMLILPVPVGELFHRLLERGKKAQPTQVKRDD